MSTVTPTSARSAVSGLRANLTTYGDQEFALFLRKAFIKGAGCESYFYLMHLVHFSRLVQSLIVERVTHYHHMPIMSESSICSFS